MFNEDFLSMPGVEVLIKCLNSELPKAIDKCMAILFSLPLEIIVRKLGAIITPFGVLKERRINPVPASLFAETLENIFFLRPLRHSSTFVDQEMLNPVSIKPSHVEC